MAEAAQSLTSKVVEKSFNAISEFVEAKYRDTCSHGIKSFAVEQGCEAGDNFLGLILSIKFSVTLKGKSGRMEGGGEEEEEEAKRGKEVVDFDLILKSQSLATSGRDSEKYFWSALFIKERMIYQEIVERLEQLAQLPLAPKLHHFYAEEEDYSSFLMDNLNSLGYYIPDFATLTLDECTSVMEALARFHALAIVLEADEGVPLVEKYEFCGAEMMFSSGLEYVFKPMVQNTYKGVLEATEKLRPDLLLGLTAFNDKKLVWNRAMELVKPGQTSFTCVCHGDPRLKNIFLSSAEASGSSGRLVAGSSKLACRFIDFQLTRYSSPITDLLYFVYTATDKRFREQHLDTLLSAYFQQFVATWTSFPAATQARIPSSVKTWSREKLEEEFWALKDYALVVAIAIIPIIYTRPEDMMDVSLANMSAAEKEKFMFQNRAQVVCNILNRNQVMRQRIFQVLEELL